MKHIDILRDHQLNIKKNIVSDNFNIKYYIA